MSKFQAGDKVKVLGGRNKGKIGVVEFIDAMKGLYSVGCNPFDNLDLQLYYEVELELVNENELPTDQSIISFVELISNPEYRKEGYRFKWKEQDIIYTWKDGIFYSISGGGAARIFEDLVNARFEIVAKPEPKYVLVSKENHLYWTKEGNWTSSTSTARIYSQEEVDNYKKYFPMQNIEFQPL